MSFIDRLDRQIDRDNARNQLEVHINNISLYAKKKKVKEQDFSEEFGADSLAEDLKVVKRIEEGFKQKKEHLSLKERKDIEHGEKIGQALEIIIAEDGEKYHWFTNNSRLTRTSHYDDLVNGVDIIVEIGPDKSETEELNNDLPINRLALAIDASSNLDAIGEKLNRNEKKLKGSDGENAPEIKYFRSSFNPNVKGALEVVIPVVIGLEKKYVDELIIASSLARASNDSLKKYPAPQDTIEKNRDHSLKKLKNHPAQIIFCDQILQQLEYYRDLLTSRSDQTGLNYQAEVLLILKEFTKIMATKRNWLANLPPEDKEKNLKQWQQEMVSETIKLHLEHRRTTNKIE